MKTMTCQELGGTCDAKISGDSPQEMVKHAIEHMEKNHPDLANKLKSTTEDGAPAIRDWSEKINDEWGPAEE